MRYSIFLTVLLKSNALKPFIILEFGKNDVADFMHGSHAFLLATAFVGIAAVDKRIYWCSYTLRISTVFKAEINFSLQHPNTNLMRPIETFYNLPVKRPHKCSKRWKKDKVLFLIIYICYNKLILFSDTKNLLKLAKVKLTTINLKDIVLFCLDWCYPKRRFSELWPKTLQD